MKKNEEKEFQPTTAEKVEQMPGWENMSDEMAENMAKSIKRLAKLFYTTTA